MRDKSKERIQREFSARFRKALDNMGYSPSQQSILGEIFGVSGQAVRKWAEGSAIPNSARMPKIASILGVRRAWLQDGEEPMTPEIARIAEPAFQGRGKPREEITITSDEATMLYNYRLLTLDQKNAIRTIISLLIKAK